MCDLAENIHTGLTLPGNVDEVHLVKGDYQYYHYGCDGTDDRGWGCGYRTLQTLCSWIRNKQLKKSTSQDNIPPVPSLAHIQQTLVNMGDKPDTFLSSKDWIGSVEVGLIIDSLYDVPWKLVHISSGSEIVKHTDVLVDHFRQKGSPIMMGGDGDSSSKGIIGICRGPCQTFLLILDPHYFGPKPDWSTLCNAEMLGWRPVDTFMDQSFYNLCLPQYKLHS